MKWDVETCMKLLNNREVKCKEAEKCHNLATSFNEMKKRVCYASRHRKKVG